MGVGRVRGEASAGPGRAPAGRRLFDPQLDSWCTSSVRNSPGTPQPSGFKGHVCHILSGCEIRMQVTNHEMPV